jgi:hypothetical protein
MLSHLAIKFHSYVRKQRANKYSLPSSAIISSHIFFVNLKVYLVLTNNSTVPILHLFSCNVPLDPLHKNLQILCKFNRNILLVYPIKMPKCTLCLIVGGDPQRI